MKIIPKLGLFRINDSALGEYAQDKTDKINANSAFVSVVPSTAMVDAKTTDWRAAIVKADDGTKANTAYKKQVRAGLEALLTAQATDCVRIANGDLPLYLSTGYEAKNIKGSPAGELPAVTGVELFYGDSTGELKVRWDVISKALNFSVCVYSDITSPDSSVIKEYINPKIGRKQTIISGLPSGQIVFVRVRANGGSTGQGTWSDPAEKRVP